MFRNFVKVSIVFGCLVLSSSLAFSQTADFFWSLNDLNTGAVNGPLVVSAQPGDTLSLFLYHSPSGPSQQAIDIGAMLDLETSQEGVVRFTAAESFDFPINIGDFLVGNRWQDSIPCVSYGEIGTVTDSFISEWGAFTLTGAGMQEDNTDPDLFLDAGYDFQAEAFLFGRVDIEVIGNPGQCVQIHVGPGDGGVAHTINSNFDTGSLLDPVFGSALITIGDVILGDTNNDQSVDLLDISSFVDLLGNSQFAPAADTNCDGNVNLLDVSPFIALLNGQGLQVVDPSPPNDNRQDDLLGDMNVDGLLNLLDIACFRALGTDCPSFQTGDVNMDGVINLLDGAPFCELLLAIE